MDTPTDTTVAAKRGGVDDAAAAARPRPPHARVAFLAGATVVFMLGAAYAAVPLYKLICQVTGMGGTTQRADRAPGAVGDTKIRVRFDATVSSGLPWEFKPVERHVDVLLGDATVVNYTALNRTVHTTTGTATFNVTPAIAGKYFSKIECFCFTEQVLSGGQKVDMPVTFFVDPALLRDPDASHIREITLSYSFFATPAARAGMAQRAAPQGPTDGKGSAIVR